MSVEVDMLIGAVVGRCYRVLKKHSVGGMGTIYAGEHEELGKPVAIKVLHARVCEKPAAIERFMREARTASAVGHPNVVDVFDLGRCDDGRPFMVMPLLDGMDCERALAERGPQKPSTVVRWLEGAALGLDALHRRGLVHRDVKPANVFLVRQDDGSEVSKIMDFGLAAFQREGTRLTAKGIVLGTPHYLPPECATGTKADVAGDVYSLAVVAYELISGELPFDHADPAYVMAAKISNTAPLLSKRATVSKELDELFRRALSRRPHKRPASCSAFIDELRAAASVVAPESERPTDPDGSETAKTRVARRQRDVRTAKMRFTFSDASASKRPTRDSVQLPTRNRGVGLTALLVLLLIGGLFWLAAPDGSRLEGADERAEARAEARVEPRADRRDDDEAGPSPSSGDTPRPSVATAHDTANHTAHDTARVARPRIERIERIDSSSPSSQPVPTVPQQDRARAERLTREANRLALRGLLPAAIERYRDATLIAPAHAAAWRGLGIANAHLNRTAEARRAFERYLRVAPNASDAQRIEARLASL